MEGIEVSAKTVEDAVLEAAIQLGTTRDKVEYEVITAGSPGFLGIGSKKAVIRARQKTDEEIEAALRADQELEKILDRVNEKNEKAAAVVEKKEEKKEKPVKKERPQAEKPKKAPVKEQKAPEKSAEKKQTEKKPAPEGMPERACFFVSGGLLLPLGLFAEEEGLGEAVVEELDEGPHEEGGDQGAHPGQQPGQGADGHADQIAADAHEPEGPLPVLRDDDGDGVVHRHPQVGGHVQGGGEAHHQHADEQEHDAQGEIWLRSDTLQHPHGEVHDIPGEEHVHQGGHPHVAPGDEQVQDQHHPA